MSIAIQFQLKKHKLLKLQHHQVQQLQRYGDIVTEGSILIGGWMEGNYTGIRYVHASGEVYAKVWYSKKEKMELNQVSVKRTGNTEKKYNIKINNFQTNFGKSLPKFQKYDTINEDKKLKLFSDFYLPITLGISTYYELEDEAIAYTKEEAKEKLINKLKTELSEKIENKEDIKDIQINVTEEETFI